MSRLVPSFILLVVLGAPLSARAQAERRPAQEIYREATQLIEQKEYAAAKPLLLELWAARRTHDVAASLGQVDYQLGNFPQSAWYLAIAVQSIPPREKAELEERYRLAYDTVRQKVAMVKVTLQPAHAELYVDAEKAERGPSSEVYLRPGSHSLEAVLGSSTKLQSIVVAAGETHQIELTVPEAAPAAGSAAAPATPPPAAPPATEPSSRSMVPAFIAGGVALVGLGVGIGFELAAQSDDSDIERLHRSVPPGGCLGAPPPGECNDLKNAAESFDSHRTNAVTGFVVAGLGAAAAVGYLLWPADKPSAGSSRPLRVSAALDHTGGAIVARGNF